MGSHHNRKKRKHRPAKEREHELETLRAINEALDGSPGVRRDADASRGLAGGPRWLELGLLAETTEGEAMAMALGSSSWLRCCCVEHHLQTQTHWTGTSTAACTSPPGGL